MPGRYIDGRLSWKLLSWKLRFKTGTPIIPGRPHNSPKRRRRLGDPPNPTEPQLQHEYNYAQQTVIFVYVHGCTSRVLVPAINTVSSCVRYFYTTLSRNIRAVLFEHEYQNRPYSSAQSASIEWYQVLMRQVLWLN